MEFDIAIKKRVEELITRHHIFLSALNAQNGELTLSNAHKCLEELEKEINDLFQDKKEHVNTMRSDKVYETQIKCEGCNRPLIAKVLLNVYSDDIVARPHFELVCVNCDRGTVILK